jgi:hypothetical protein
MSSVKGTPAPPDVVCVLGMHRSGTSAVARTLDILGVDFGPREQLFPARADNPGGFFEHKGLVEVNDEILRRFGGSWHEPPILTPGWERSTLLSDLRNRAVSLIRDDFAGRPFWGWKDPRACLTLPFWQPLLPPTRYVLCLRSPLAVARSLEVRDGFPVDKSGRLWMDHMISALTLTEGESRLMVAYEDLLGSSEVQVHRISQFLYHRAGSEITSPALQGSFRRDLQHHPVSLEETLSERRLPFGARMLYAGLVLALVQHRDSSTGPDEMNGAVKALIRAVAEEQPTLGGQDADRRPLLEAYHRLLAVQEDLHAEKATLKARAESLRAELKRYQVALAELGNHPLLRVYRSFRIALFPPGSRREMAYMRVRRSVRPGTERGT